jgi:DNA polymerase III delta subunit
VTIPEVEDLKRVLAGGGPSSAILVAGGDEAVREGLLDAVVADMKRVASPVAIVRLDADGAKTDAWQKLGALAQEAPLFGEGTVALVGSVGSGAKVPPELTAFLASPPPHLRAVLLAEPKSAKSPLATQVAPVGQVIAPAALRDGDAGTLISRAAKEAGVALDSRAQEALADLVGADRAAIDTAIHLLREFAGEGGRVTEADLAGLVQRSRRPLPWDLQDAIYDRNLPKAAKVAQRELEDAKDPRGEAIILFHKITRQVRTLRAAQALVERGADADECMKRLELKRDFQWDKTKRGAARYQVAELDAYLKEAPAAEIRIKRGNAGSEPLVLDLLARLLSGGRKGRG